MARGQQRQTRRRGNTRSKSTRLTIPELKHSFDRLDTETVALLRKPGTVAAKVPEFQKLWMSIFHKKVSPEAAQSYLAIKKKQSKYGKTRKQRGGMAPVDYQMRPGVEGTYGYYPAYVNSGLSFYDSIQQRGMSEECGVKDTTPILPASMGSNQAGGASFLEAMTRPISSSNPSSFAQDLQTMFQGRPLPPSPAAETAHPPYAPSEPSTRV